MVSLFNGVINQMSGIQLEVGKTYRTRGGHEVRINEEINDEEYPFRGDGLSFKSNGCYFSNEQEDCDDLIEEVVPEAPEAILSTFKSGAVRSSDASNTRFDLISPIGLRRLAETYAEGAVKYGDDNWLKGMPASDILNHCLRHINLWLSGDQSEDHMAHAAWNLFAVMHFEESRPELIDVATRKATSAQIQNDCG